MSLVRVRRAAQITLPRDIRQAAKLEEGDYLEAEVTAGGILLRPVSVGSREPTREQEAEIQAVTDDVRAELAKARHEKGGVPRSSREVSLEARKLARSCGDG